MSGIAIDRSQSFTDLSRQFLAAESEFEQHVAALHGLLKTLHGYRLFGKSTAYSGAKKQLDNLLELLTGLIDDLGKAAPEFKSAGAASVLQTVAAVEGKKEIRARLLVQQTGQLYLHNVLSAASQALERCSLVQVDTVAQNLTEAGIDCKVMPLLFLPIDRLHLYRRLCEHINKSLPDGSPISGIVDRFDQVMPKLVAKAQSGFRSMLPDCVAELIAADEFILQIGRWTYRSFEFDLTLTDQSLYVLRRDETSPVAAAVGREQALPHLMLQELCVVISSDQHKLFQPTKAVDFWAWQACIHDMQGHVAEELSELVALQHARSLPATNSLLTNLPSRVSLIAPRHIGLLLDAVPYMEDDVERLLAVFDEVRHRLKAGGVLMQGQLTATAKFKKSKPKWHVIHCEPSDGFEVRPVPCLDNKTFAQHQTAIHSHSLTYCLPLFTDAPARGSIRRRQRPSLLRQRRRGFGRDAEADHRL